VSVNFLQIRGKLHPRCNRYPSTRLVSTRRDKRPKIRGEGEGVGGEKGKERNACLFLGYVRLRTFAYRPVDPILEIVVKLYGAATICVCLIDSRAR